MRDLGLMCVGVSFVILFVLLGLLDCSCRDSKYAGCLVTYAYGLPDFWHLPLLLMLCCLEDDGLRLVFAVLLVAVIWKFLHFGCFCVVFGGSCFFVGLRCG